MANFYKRNEKVILSLLLAVFGIGALLVWLDLDGVFSPNKSCNLTENNDSLMVASDTLIQQNNVKVPVIKYKVVDKGTESGNEAELWAKIDDDFRNTGIDEVGALTLVIYDQRDYDGDGLTEALVCFSTGTGSNAVEYEPFIVYYDLNSGAFKEAHFKDLKEYNLEVKEWKGKWSLYGGSKFHNERYIFEKGNISKVSEYTMPKPQYAKKLLTVKPDMCDDFSNKLVVNFDLDNDGAEETITCCYNYGSRMTGYEPVIDVFINWGNGNETSYVAWFEMSVLESVTNGVHDIFDGIEYYIEKWDGDDYVRKMWNGKKFE